jgi:hypothetical protein
MACELLSGADFANEKEPRRVLGDAAAGFLIQGTFQPGCDPASAQYQDGRSTADERTEALSRRAAPAVARIALCVPRPSRAGRRSPFSLTNEQTVPVGCTLERTKKPTR